MAMSAFPHAMPRGNPQEILAAVWQRSLPLVRHRLQTLRAAADQSHLAPLPEAVRLEAADIAHKLAGSLGMFGFPQGSDIAKHLELLLDTDEPLPALRFQELTAQLEQNLGL